MKIPANDRLSMDHQVTGFKAVFGPVITYWQSLKHLLDHDFPACGTDTYPMQGSPKQQNSDGRVENWKKHVETTLDLDMILWKH